MTDSGVQQRVEWIDAARGLGIVAIVVGHMYLPDQATPGIFTFLYAFHVPLFMFLSGLMFSPGKFTFRDLLVAKFRTVVLPYLIWTCLSITIFLVLGQWVAGVLGRAPKNTDWWAVSLDAVWSNPSHGGLKWNTPLWFLTALFIVQILGWALLRMTEKVHWTVPMVGSLTISVLAYLYLLGSDLPWSIERAALLLPFFCAGSLSRKRVLSWRLSSVHPALPVTGALVLFVAMYFAASANGTVDYVNKDFGTFPLFLLGAALGIVATGFLAVALQGMALVCRLGEASLTILVLHKFPVVVLQLLLVLMPVALGGLAWLGVAILGVAATLLSSLFDKPLRRFAPWMLGVRATPLVAKK